MLGSWEVVAQLSDEAKAGSGSNPASATCTALWRAAGRNGGTNDGDFAARLEDEDDWTRHEHAQPGARRLE